MSYGMTLLRFQNGRMATIPLDAIVAVLVRYGCRVSQLREGSNEIGLPHTAPKYSPFGHFAILSIKDGEVTEFVCTVHRPLKSAGASCSHSSMS